MTRYFALLMLLASFETLAAPAPGTADAAKAMIPTYLGQLFTVVESPVGNGDHATAKATILDRSCILVLIKHPTANESGWVVDKVDCNPGEITKETYEHIRNSTGLDS